MSANSYELSPRNPEQESIEGLIAACRDQANRSRKFRIGENRVAGTEIPVIDAHDTTYVVEFHAEHLFEDGDFGGNEYDLTLRAFYYLEEMVPAELTSLVLESGQPALYPDEDSQIKAEYSLCVYLKDDGTMEWSEGRNYDIWKMSDDGQDSESTADNSDDYPGSNYYLNLGQKLDEDDNTEASKQTAPLTPEERQDKEAFELMIGRAGLSGIEKAGYVKKAHEILKLYQLGLEAEFENKNYFPDDVVQTINAQHTN